jgi:predicted Zn-dependent peptidase
MLAPIGSILAVASLAAAALVGGPHGTPRAPHQRAEHIADDTLVISYMVDSVRVIQRINPFTDVVAVNVYLLGGSSQLTPATQGIESLILSASRYGTRSYPDTTLRIAWGQTGSAMTSEVTSDWTMLGFRGVSSEFNKSWDIVTERLTAPSLRPEAVDVARAKLVSALRQRRSTPDGEIGYAADSIMFAGHSYGNSPYGTEANLEKLDSAALAGYVKAHVERSRLLVVVAGGATRAMVEGAVHRTLQRLPLGAFTWAPPAPLPPRTASVMLIPRQSATNYLIGVFSGPPPTSDEYPAFQTATSFLGQLITTAVREKRGLSYAASASVEERELPTGVIYVSTGRPDTVVRLINRQIAKLQDPDSLPAGMTFTSDKNSLSSLFARSTSSAQVESLARAQLLQGDFRLADNLPRRMRSVSSSAVRQAARKYMQNIRFVYAGDTTLVKRKSFEKL